jgi:hypothetical protein
VNAAAAEYDLVREKKLALIVALQKNRGELSAEALKKLLVSASSGNAAQLLGREHQARARTRP